MVKNLDMAGSIPYHGCMLRPTPTPGCSARWAVWFWKSCHAIHLFFRYDAKARTILFAGFRCRMW